jgi:carboxymethylenebutenolidase
MCVDSDSRPPMPPIAGGATDARDLRLTSSDGTRFMAYAARATTRQGARAPRGHGVPGRAA